MDETARDLFRVRPDDPAYVAAARAEEAFWARVQPGSLEDVDTQAQVPGPVDRYVNARFTGDERVPWEETIARYGRFRRGAILGTSSLRLEARILDTNPDLHVTFFDLAAGGLARRAETLGRRFPGRVATCAADLNFLALEPGAFDLVVSSSTIHHVTNLEHLAWQIGRALAPGGRFFLQDYVGEPRFQFAEGKRRLYERLFERDLARQGRCSPGLAWLDASDLSPFCGVRADEILDAFAAQLEPLEVRTAGTLTVPLLRSRPHEDHAWSPWRTDKWIHQAPLWRQAIGRVRHRFARLFGTEPHQCILDPAYLNELFLVGDVAADAGLVRPCLAFAVYRVRGSA